MAGYVVLKNGAFERAGLCQPAEVAVQAVNEGEAAYEVPQEVIALPELNPEPLRALLWQQVKAKRDAVIDGGASTPAGAVDSDEKARDNIAGAALAALIAKGAGAAYSVDWTLLDNSVATFDADMMIAVGLAVMAHVNAAHDRARTLRSAIEAAADAAELLRIDIASGWPA